MRFPVTTCAFLLLVLVAPAPAQTEDAGRFGRAIRPGEKFPAAPANPVYSVVPITVECWAKLEPAGKGQFNVLVANEMKHSGTHWEIFAQKETGFFAALLPIYQPAEIVSNKDIVDGQWHYLAMTFDGQTCRLFVDAEKVAEQQVAKGFMYPDRGPLTIGYVGGLENTAAGLIDEVRISRVERSINNVPDAPFEPDTETVGLWHFDEDASAASFADDSRTRNAAELKEKGDIVADRGIERTRWMDMDLWPFLSATVGAPAPENNITYKGICIQLGKDKKAAICFDTELMRWSAAWTGDFLHIPAFREGLGGHPTVAGEVQFGTTAGPGWAKPGTEDFADPRPDKLGPLPKEWAKYKGLYVHGDDIILSYTVGDVDVLEMPRVERHGDEVIFTRVFHLPAFKERLSLQVLEVPESRATAKFKVGDGIWQGSFGAGNRKWAAGINVPELGNWGFVQPGRNDAPGPLVLEIPPQPRPLTFRLKMWSGQEPGLKSFEAALNQVEEDPDLPSRCKGGPLNWPDAVATQGALGAGDGPYVVDTLTAPEDNPWKSFLRFGGLDFFSNGDIAVCSVSGDVWVVSGVDEKLENLKWNRFAAGLFQPLGLKIVDDRVYVLGRDQITRLHDLNADGEADFYENFNNDAKVTTNGHAYVTCLETDPEGNFYYVKCGDNTEHGGTILRVSKDGSKLDVFATGVRNMNGLGVSPTGEVTAADNQGEWVPASRLDVVTQGEFLGYLPMAKQNPPPDHPGKPLCWMPQNVDNSSGGQCWVTSDKWGPFKGHMLHTSYGAASLMLVLQEKVDGIDQGGVVTFPLRFDSGIMRGRFREQDGQLYLCGMKGWQTSGVKDGALHRVRYTGKPVHMPSALHVHENGIRLTFPEPLDKELAVDLDSYGVLQWNYRWTGDYGSRQYSAITPDQQGYDELKVKAAHVSDDGKSVFVEVENLQPVMQMQITYDLESTDGEQIRGDIYNTVHALGDAADVTSQ